MPKSKFYKKYIRPINNTIAYWLLSILIFIFRLLPQKFAIWFGGILAIIAYPFAFKSRRIIKRNIEIMVSNGYDLPRNLGLKNFKESGRNLVRIFRVSKDLPKGKLNIEFSGREIFDKYYQDGKGVIVLTGHIGPFEYIPAYIGSLDYKVSVIGRQLFDSRVDKILVQSRNEFGTVNIPSDSSAMKLIRLLRDGYSLGILADVNTRRVAYSYAEFFKREERTVTGPVSLARIVGLPLIPMAIYPKGLTDFEIVCLEPIEIPKTNDKDNDIAIGLKLMNITLEKLIMQMPENWMWYHPRFRDKR